MKIQKHSSQFLYHVNHLFIDAPLDFENIRLLQLGRIFCLPSTEVAEHTHLDWYELTVVTQGKGRVEVNGNIIPVKSGDIVLSLPCDTHAIYSDEAEPIRYDFFSFFCVNEEMKESLEKIGAAVYPAEKRICKSDRIAYLVSLAIDELNTNRADMTAVLSPTFLQILLYVLRAYGEATLDTNRTVRDSKTLCYKIMQYIDTHIYTLKNLYELAEITNYNYSYLSAVFKETTGTTIAEHFRNRRMTVAKKLITEEEMSASEVARLLQYSSIFAFSKAYKRYYGMPPRDSYKKK